MSQVPSVQFKKDKDGKNVVALGEEGGWGWECRELFIPRRGWKQVGVDLSGLELRCLAHYLWPFDGGEFADVLLNKDLHGINQEILGLANRGDAKSFFFALLYGAGNLKLGTMLYPQMNERSQMTKGKMLRNKLMSGIKGFHTLNKRVVMQAEREGCVKLLDGRSVPVRNAYSALNTLLQSTGAVLAKYWIVQVLDDLDEAGYVQREDFNLFGYYHDELQFECRPEIAEDLCKIVVEASARAGVRQGFKLKLDSEGKIGNNWAECH